MMFLIGALMSFCLPLQAQIPGPTPEEQKEREQKEREQKEREQKAREQRAREQEESRKIEEAYQRYRLRLQKAQGPSIPFGGSDAASGVLGKLSGWLQRDSHNIIARLSFRGGGTDAGLKLLAGGEIEAAVLDRELTEEDKKALSKSFPDPASQPAQYAFAKRVLVMAVHQNNQVPGLSYKQIEDIYRQDITRWDQVGASGGEIARLGTLVFSPSCFMFFMDILKGSEVLFPEEKNPGPRPVRSFEEIMREVQERGARFPGHGPYPRYKTDAQVIAEVAKDAMAIGYCLMPPDGQVPEGVRFVPVVPPTGDKPVAPTLENVLLDKYPLQHTFSLLVRPDASETTKEFVQFACSKEAASIIRERGFVPVSEKAEILMARRLIEARAGKGVTIQAAGAVRSTLLQDLAVEYVKAKAVVQMQYTVADEAVAVEQFLGGKELLLLQGPPSVATLKVHGARWTKLKAETLAIAGRAGAIVTSIVNQEEAMTLDRIRAIFAGEVAQWGDSLAMAQKDIHCYGLGAADPVAALFFSGVMRGTPCKNLRVEKDTAEILTALILDPQGIALVDLAGIPPDATLVRIVAIGPADKAVKPDGRTVADGTYPLAMPLVLYVSPQAGETAKDFVQFIRSGACDAVFRRHGFVPAGQRAESDETLRSRAGF
jgi:ABC-type phosphate transport system substrate-binding protein